jgi:glucose-6-phosphate isomerase
MVSAYDSRLHLLVPYLKQLWMESLGKHIDLDGRPLSGPACPILWGDVGTNAQHAFFQLLHQGAQGVAIELIANVHPSHSAHASHDALWANLIAQAQALSGGHIHEDNAKTCWGGHPITMVLLERLDPKALGALIALWEYRVIALAAIQNINPFDQWGVELGKSIARSALEAIEGKAQTTGLERTPPLDATSASLIHWFREQRQTSKKKA